METPGPVWGYTGVVDGDKEGAIFAGSQSLAESYYAPNVELNSARI